ncbi:unnamed protein product [Ectocarpus sp. 6 AP-2014]
MRAVSSLVSLSALATSSADSFVPAGGNAIRASTGKTNAAMALRCLSRARLTSSVRPQAALRRPTAVRTMMMMSDAAVTEEEAAAAAPTGELTELARLEIRIGKIVEIARHPDADSLYVEKVDLGQGEEEGPRTIVSGLVNFCEESDLLGREVVVLCNLKPVNMKGVTSAGMLLCSSNEDHSKVEPLCPPEGVPLGELVTFDGHLPSPVDAGNRAGKAWKRASKTLAVDDSEEAKFTGEKLPATFMTSKGPITSPLPGSIS